MSLMAMRLQSWSDTLSLLMAAPWWSPLKHREIQVTPKLFHTTKLTMSCCPTWSRCHKPVEVWLPGAKKAHFRRFVGWVQVLCTGIVHHQHDFGKRTCSSCQVCRMLLAMFNVFIEGIIYLFNLHRILQHIWLLFSQQSFQLLQLQSRTECWQLLTSHLLIQHWKNCPRSFNVAKGYVDGQRHSNFNVVESGVRQQKA